MRRLTLSLVSALLLASASALTAGEAPALVEIRFADVASADTPNAVAAPNGKHYVLDSTPLVGSGEIVGARVANLPAGTPRDNFFGRCVVEVTFSPAIAANLRSATADRLGHTVAFLVRGKIVSTAGLGGPLSESAIIDGNFSCDDAADLVSKLTK